MYNKYTLTILLIHLLIIIIVLIEFNTDYKLINNYNPINIKLSNYKLLGTLYIGTHNYEHKDIFITFKQFEKYNEKFYMLFADKSWNHLLEPFRPKNIEFLYVKEKTVEKISLKLLMGYNIIMFLYYESVSTGPFYMLQNTKSPLVLFKIKSKNTDTILHNHFNSSFADIYWNNLLKKFILEFKTIKYKLTKNTPCKLFIKQLKDKLYS